MSKLNEKSKDLAERESIKVRSLRKSLGLGVTPHPVKGDVYLVQRLKKRIKDLEKWCL